MSSDSGQNLTTAERMDIELNPGYVEGTFYHVSVSIDGGDPVSLYAEHDSFDGMIFHAAEDEWKAKRALTGYTEEMDEALEYLEGLVRLPKPRDPDTGDVLDLRGADFYFTEVGYSKYIQSLEKLERVLNGAVEGGARRGGPYRNVEAFVDVESDMTDVVYKDDFQIAVEK